jgi:hypothetical protein
MTATLLAPIHQKSETTPPPGVYTKVPAVLGDEPVYIQDWCVQVDDELRGGVSIHVHSDDGITDFRPNQARAFARALNTAADRAERAEAGGAR